MGPAAPAQGSERRSKDQESLKSSSGHRGWLQLGSGAKPTGGEGVDGEVLLCTPSGRERVAKGKVGD